MAPKSPPADPFVRALDGLSADKDIKKALLALEKTLSPLKAVGRYSPKASKEAYQAVADNPLMTLFAVEFLRDTRNSVADRTWVVKQLLPKLED